MTPACRSDIPENERWYVCEEMDSKYGNLLSRDIVSFIIYCVCRMDKGVKRRQQVYLDITQLQQSRGGPYTREQINDKLEGVLEIYEKFMREDPIEIPMRIYPAVHYTMGGLWVDYETNADGSWNVNSPAQPDDQHSGSLRRRGVRVSVSRREPPRAPTHCSRAWSAARSLLKASWLTWGRPT